MGQKINKPVLIIATVYAQEIWQRPGLNKPEGPQCFSTNSLLNPNGKRTKLTVMQITANETNRTQYQQELQCLKKLYQKNIFCI